jgi:Holliday junction resolvase-like predicted endonuclease
VGRDAEAVARRWLEARQWTVLAANLVIDRDEIDLVCLEPGPVPALVFVEVRGHSSRRFGAAEESVDARKLGRNYRAAMAIVRSGWPRRQGLPGDIRWRVDVVAVELGSGVASDAVGAMVRHIRGVTLD